ncbi:MAG TPA: Ig-like domain-containing protein, partial [Rubricoccaceae bacterium]
MLRLPLLLAGLLGLAACATPVAPSGGPPDTTPPALVRTFPADGATGVTSGEVTLTFSERLDPATAGRAVRVTPEPETPPRVTVRGNALVVSVPALRDSTTYVVSVGTELADARNVALRAPITVAFATGSQIDRGRIEGTVRDPATGAPARALAVWAYALPDTLAPDTTAGRVAPDYRTETGADGAFRLDYLRPGLYAVAAVQDRNRNGRADAGERFAAAPTRALQAVAPDTAGTARDSLARPARPSFFVTSLDTVPPAPRSVRVLSDRRVAVRFSESVRLVDRGAFSVE